MSRHLGVVLGLSLVWGCDGNIAEGVDAGPEAIDASSASGDAGPADASVVDLDFEIHERSIGVHVGALADTGSMSGTADSATLSLSDSTLPAAIGQGDRLVLWPGSTEEVEYFVAARVSDTELTLQSTLPADAAVAPYRLERAYSSIASWGAATKGNLIGQKRREIGICYNDGAFVENVVISGSMSDAMHYRVLTVAEGSRHQGLAGSGAVVKPGTAGHGILVLEDFSQVEWLEVTDWTTDAGGSYDGINIKAEDVLIQNVIVHDDGHGDVLNSDAGGIQLERDLGTATVRNSFVYNVARIGIGTHTASGTVLTIQNSTAFGCTLADNSPDAYGCITARGPNSVVHASNVIALDAGGLLDFFAETGQGASFSDLSVTNLSSDASAPGLSPVSAAIAAEVLTSVAAGTENLHLAEVSPALGVGTPIAAFDTDIDGDARGDAWDIGADEAN